MEDFHQFHFAQPLWLWLWLVIPFVLLLGSYVLGFNTTQQRLEKFIDPHLIPYLLRNQEKKKRKLGKGLFLWSLVWMSLTFALAGPRWNFQEVETFSKDQSLVILLDLSESMNATDVKPSRLVMAKQKIEDMLNHSQGVKIGLVIFAADPHMIVPLTEDRQALRHLLPSLSTDLVYIQGSRLAPAMEMAKKMLDAEPGENKALLVISDGGFDDASAMKTAKELAGKGIAIYVMGVGTLAGASVQDHAGNVIKKNGVSPLSKLEVEKLKAISDVGQGRYLEADHASNEEKLIFKDLEERAKTQMEISQKNQFWEERFYLWIFPVLPILLWWFRRETLFLCIFLACLHFPIEAMEIEQFFKNREQRGQKALEEGDYETALQSFEDPYRQGVVCYKAGKYQEAEECFRQSQREEVALHAKYNLGNALAQQHKLKEAINAYEEVLAVCPDHTRARENLELIKKMLEQKEQEQPSDSSDKSNQDDKQEDKKEKGTENSKEQNQEQRSQDQEQETPDSQKEEKESEDSKQESSQQDEEKNKPPKDSQQEEQPPAQQADEKEKDFDKQDQQQDNEQQVEEAGEQEPLPPESEEPKERRSAKTQEDYDADLWLNRLNQDTKNFLKSKCYIESKKNGTTQGIDPW